MRVVVLRLMLMELRRHIGVGVGCRRTGTMTELRVAGYGLGYGGVTRREAGIGSVKTPHFLCEVGHGVGWRRDFIGTRCSRLGVHGLSTLDSALSS